MSDGHRSIPEAEATPNAEIAFDDPKPIPDPSHG